MKSNDIRQRVKALLEWMQEKRYAAYVVPTADPHNSEYLADHWKCREWLTGFTGSAGTAVVAASGEAALWTDSRYYLQAEEQLADTPFRLMRDGEEGVPSIAEWIARKIPAKARVGLLGETTTLESLDALFGPIRNHYDIEADSIDPFHTIWPDRPALPISPITLMDENVAGRSAGEKTSLIYNSIFPSDEEAGIVLLNDLAEIAWTLNLRGNDIEYNPVFLAYLMIGKHQATLFTAEERISSEIRNYLADRNIRLLPYPEWRKALAALPPKAKVALPPTANLEERLYCERHKVPYFVTPWDNLLMARAIKTAEEQEGFRQAMLRDGVAMVSFLRHLDEAMATGEEMTEMSADKLLTRLRSEQPGFRGLSFATIAGYGPHGAIVHYEADDNSDARLAPSGLLLLDSGAQYDCGTTDITRTIALGPLTDEERRAYTAVLKAHIGLSRCIFPIGTTGLQLDTAARYPLWLAGYDFGHGTGHGVGSHLCVHEGPQQIRKNLRGCTTIPFRAGMVITDEPGLYVTGRFGVRIENILLCVPHSTTPSARFWPSSH